MLHQLHQLHPFHVVCLQLSVSKALLLFLLVFGLVAVSKELISIMMYYVSCPMLLLVEDRRLRASSVSCHQV